MNCALHLFREVLHVQILALVFQLHCCGSLNYTDYWRLDVPNKHKGKVPESCCKNETLCKTVQSSDHGWIQLPDDDDDEIANYIYLEV